jgi:uncharacterized protein
VFINFYYQLKSEGVPVSLNEWMTLMEALAKGLSFSSLTGFYYLARSILVKSEAHFDRYDMAFSQYFTGIETQEDVIKQALHWLEKSLPPREMSPELRSPFAQLDLDELRRLLEDRLKTQHEEHHGGSHWIGTGGTSPLGHSGEHPSGLRIGGESHNLSAVQVAAKRQYREFRDDHITGVRQFEVALRKLRQFSTKEDGPKDILDLDGTINATCKNAGQLRLVWERPRRNMIKVVVLMDSGGSMNRYMQICSRLFEAANRASHFKDLKFYYFHNCIYDDLFANPHLYDRVPTNEVMYLLNSEYRLVIVGDASMASSELTMAGGAIDWDVSNKLPGILWLKRLAKPSPYAVWLNPIPSAYWDRSLGSHTISMVQQVFPMYHLSPEGFEQAVKKLKSKSS